MRGGGGTADAQTFSSPLTASVDALGAVWIADSVNARLLRQTPQALTTTGPNTLSAAVGSNGGVCTASVPYGS